MDLHTAFNIGSDSQYVRNSDLIKPYVKRKEGFWLLQSLIRMHDILEEEGIAEKSIEAISRWIAKLKKDYSEGQVIAKEDADKLHKESDSWRAEIRRNLDAKPLVEIRLQSGLNPNELQRVAEKKPSEFIPSEIWDKMTDIEKSDLSDAAKCLLLGTATPSVMVGLRGAEASLRNYYRSKTQKQIGKKSWRQLTTELKGEATDLGIEDTFIGYLDYIGDAKRNFAQHPNKIYSLREAVMIFIQVVALIEDIYLQI